MKKNLLYIVHEYAIDDYEDRWNDYHIFYHKENAIKKLQDIKEQDMMPIVDEEGYEIHCDNETHFEAGIEGEYSRGCVCVKIITTPILDYHF